MHVLLIISSCYFHVIFTVKVTSSWRWRKLCCLPNILFFELCYAAALVGAVVLTIFILDRDIPKWVSFYFIVGLTVFQRLNLAWLSGEGLISSVRDLWRVSIISVLITDLLARSLTLLISSSHRPWTHEDR